MRRKQAPFEIGDKIVRKYDGALLTVLWSSKNPECRAEQLIATEANGYCHPTTYATCFEMAA